MKKHTARMRPQRRLPIHRDKTPIRLHPRNMRKEARRHAPTDTLGHGLAARAQDVRRWLRDAEAREVGGELVPCTHGFEHDFVVQAVFAAELDGFAGFDKCFVHVVQRDVVAFADGEAAPCGVGGFFAARVRDEGGGGEGQHGGDAEHGR
jgi:hypothetical protein